MRIMHSCHKKMKNSPVFKLQVATGLFFHFVANAEVQGQEVVPVLTARHTDETTAGTLMP